MIGPLRGFVRRRPVPVLGFISLLFVAGWFTFLPLDASVTSDDGAYAIHVLELDRTGSFSVPHALAGTDPGGRLYPYVNSSVTEDGYFPGARHAVWVRTLASAHAILGVTGMRAVVAAGFAASVMATAALAGEIHGRDRCLPAGALALMSPLAFNALQLWAHVWSVAAVAVLMLASVWIVRSGIQLKSVLLGGVAAAVAAAVRGEGLFFALGVAAALCLVGLVKQQLSAVVAGTVLVAAAVGAYLGSAAYAVSIVGSASAAGAGTNRADSAASAFEALGGRVEAALQTFLSTSYDPAAFVMLVMAMALAAVGTVAVRRGDFGNASTFLWLAAGVWLARTVAFPTDMASGLVGAWPVVLLACVRRWHDVGDEEKQLLLAVALASVAVAFTQYDQGGGLNWGGRFIAPAIPALIVVVVGSLTSRSEIGAPKSVAGAAVALAVVCFVASLGFDASLRLDHDEVASSIAGATALPVVTGHPALPRLSWRTYPDVEWLLVPLDDERGGIRVARELGRAGIDEVVLYGVSRRTAEQITGRQFAADVEEPVKVSVR